MSCTWLLAVALAVASTDGQEIGDRQPQSAATPARQPAPKNPFARLFLAAPGDAAAKPAPVPLFRTLPGRQPFLGAEDGVPLDGESVEIICGMSVARKSAQIDRGILLSANRGKGLAVRRVEPGFCGAARPVTPK